MEYLSIYLLTLGMVAAQDLSTPSSLLQPRNYNHHPYQIRQYLEEVTPEPTKQGPVLFPNDAPPPPRPPLVVTSRPLAESVARSELNNTVAASTYVRPVYRQNYNGLRLVTQQPTASQYNVPDRDLDYNEGQNYAFSYIVKDQKTGDDFSHKQESSGSATNGEYRVRLPDGRVQIVSYTADENGYKANVRYDDEIKPNTNYMNNYKDTFNSVNVKNDYNTNLNIKDTYNANLNIKDNYNLNQNYKINDNYNLNYNPNPVKPNLDFNQYNYRDEIPVKENAYDSKEYFDYSAENYKNPDEYLFQPSTTVKPFHTTIKPFHPNTVSYKFTPTTVRPAYDEIKHLFTTPNYANNIEINSPSSYKFDDVVLIGNKQNYINNNLISTTPTSYIVSSVNSASDRINSKPVLSDSFYTRINKYLTFKKK
ncbi:GATA zinc finger domain-containing protein 14-like [Colias croceus]|uniref:GATA zinc finger domain-containing protein 14-like n=1 Tax=Colias crocea TaxID=72248 RepID=UPI001E27C796|nr:GATA zinc finger domain-containing protein 14-like [Colias croceus]